MILETKVTNQVFVLAGVTHHSDSVAQRNNVICLISWSFLGHKLRGLPTFRFVFVSVLIFQIQPMMRSSRQREVLEWLLGSRGTGFNQEAKALKKTKPNKTLHVWKSTALNDRKFHTTYLCANLIADHHSNSLHPHQLRTVGFVPLCCRWSPFSL